MAGWNVLRCSSVVAIGANIKHMYTNLLKRVFQGKDEGKKVECHGKVCRFWGGFKEIFQFCQVLYDLLCGSCTTMCLEEKLLCLFFFQERKSLM